MRSGANGRHPLAVHNFERQRSFAMMSKGSPLSERSESASSSPYSSSPRVVNGRQKYSVPQVEVGAPCLRCGRGCEGLLLHVWRKICINCYCPREVHKVSLCAGRRGVESKGTLCHVEEGILQSYVWFPPGIDADLVKKYMDSLPEEHVPLRGSKGEEKRNRLYLHQLPLHDLDPEACHKMTETEKKRLVRFADKFKKNACGVGIIQLMQTKEKMNCVQCNKSIESNQIYVTADRAPAKFAWHPSCFSCGKCSELLVDLIYFFNEEESKVYCGRHFAELKIPRCFGCDELITADSYTEAEGKIWHKEHFCCEKCDDPLQGKQYTTNNGRILCQKCFDKYEAEDCQRCHLPITLGSRRIRKRNMSFHEECFVCKRCRESLTDRKYYFSEDDFLCEDCIQPVSQCFACKEGILPTTEYLRHESRTWHTNCFVCVSCKKSLIGEGFQEYTGSLLCMDCYVQKVSKKCYRCHKPITNKGVQFNLSMFHPECFQCTDCSKPLTGEKASDKRGDPYCQVCVLKFAKICNACNEPITSRHTVYKKKTYHLQCFKCTQCGIPIGKNNFYETSLNDVLCEPCAGKNI